MRLFDASQKFTIKHLTDSGIKDVAINFPSDDDWTTREVRRRDVIEFGFNGEAKTEREEPDIAESELVARLCPELANVDPDEAGRILDQLSTAIVLNEDEIVSANRLTVKLRVLQAVVSFDFRMPTSKELEKFNRKWVNQQRLDKRRVASVKDLPFLQKLSQTIREGSSGYVEGSAIPIVHEAAAVIAAFGGLKAALEESVNP